MRYIIIKEAEVLIMRRWFIAFRNLDGLVDVSEHLDQDEMVMAASKLKIFDIEIICVWSEGEP
jgi:hypothetical protein